MSTQIIRIYACVSSIILRRLSELRRVKTRRTLVKFLNNKKNDYQLLTIQRC